MTTLILTLFSTSPLFPSTWTSHLATLLPELQSHLPLSSSSQRFLDRPSQSSAGGHYVHESTLVTSSPQTQATCTSIVHLLGRTTASLDLRTMILQPRSPVHKTFSPDTASSSTRPTRPRLAVFDMDSTLIQQEVVDELARFAGVYDRVAAITEAAMRGDPSYADFAASLRARVALLAGVESGVWDTLKSRVVTFTPGARELIRCLKADGWVCAVLSGGFVPLAEWVRTELGLDYARANVLETDEQGRLSGRLVEGAEIVDGERKRSLLREIAQREGIAADSVIAVGDGSNDLLMMGEAALGIAFNAKPRVQERAPAVINGPSLVHVLYLLGWTEDEIEAVVAQSTG